MRRMVQESSAVGSARLRTRRCGTARRWNGSRKRGERKSMDTPQDLLEAICLKPDDDAPRERYATMIEPSDPDHAELIRLQLARAKQERAAGAVKSDPTGREGSLLTKNAARWSGYMAKL